MFSIKCIPEEYVDRCWKYPFTPSEDWRLMRYEARPSENIHYKLVRDIFPLEQFTALQATANDKKFNFDADGAFALFPQLPQTELIFDAQFQWTNHDVVFKKYQIEDLQVISLYKTIIERFAKELQLIGKHEIYAEVACFSYPPIADPGKVYEQGWHWDRDFPSMTMVTVLQNDLEYVGAGLDLVFNQDNRTPEQLEAENYCEPVHLPIWVDKHRGYFVDHTRCIPESYSTSVCYPDNGAILFSCQMGNLLH